MTSLAHDMGVLLGSTVATYNRPPTYKLHLYDVECDPRSDSFRLHSVPVCVASPATSAVLTLRSCGSYVTLRYVTLRCGALCVTVPVGQSAVGGGRRRLAGARRAVWKTSAGRLVGRGRVARVADGLSDKQSPRAKKLLPAGAVLWEWDADPEFDEPAGAQWLMLLPKKWNPRKQGQV